MKPAISLHTKEIIQGQGTSSAIHSFRPPSTSLVNPRTDKQLHSSQQEAGESALQFFTKYTLPQNCKLHLGLLMGIQLRKEAIKSSTTHTNTQKEIRKFLTSKLHETRK